MSTSAANITVPTDIANPGQYFACCGLLELADRLWPGAEGWFEIAKPTCVFKIATLRGTTLHELLEGAKRLELTVGDGHEGEDKEDGRVEPIVVTAPFRLVLDWWSEKSIKTWAGRMEEGLIFRLLLHAIASDESDPFNCKAIVLDGNGKKKEPFYFDCRRGYLGHALDSGFSPDKHKKMKSECFPAVEALCFIGLQRARPLAIADCLQYTVWQTQLPVNTVAPVVAGLVSTPGSLVMRFKNFSREEGGRYGSYSRATPERKDYGRTYYQSV